jgi:hypothetical protein
MYLLLHKIENPPKVLLLEYLYSQAQSNHRILLQTIRLFLPKDPLKTAPYNFFVWGLFIEIPLARSEGL